MENEKDNELPAGWVETKLDQICEILDSFRIPINNEERIERIKGISEDKLFPYYGATGQVGVIDEYLFDGEYILLGEDGAPFLDAFKNKAYIVNGKFWVNNHAHILKAHLSNQFVLHYLNQFGFRGYVSGTTRLKLTQLAMKEIPVPLPPLAEQHRIVAKLEELFSELDKGVETLRAAQQQLKVYRQAVLQWAFEGKLTEEWRKEQKELPSAAQLIQKLKTKKIIDSHKNKNGVENSFGGDSAKQMPEIPSSWGWVFVEQILAFEPNAIKAGPFGSALKKEYYVSDGYKIYGQEQVIAGNASIGNYYISHEKYVELMTNRVKPFDILISLVGTVGKVLILPENARAGIINPRLIKITVNRDYYCPIFFKYYFESSMLKGFYCTRTQGSTMEILNSSIIKALPFPLCSLPEQQQIVAEIESRLSVCDKLAETIEQSLLQAEALRQSILKQAFAGKLVPQDPSDEPAEKLLARIRTERAAAEPVNLKSAKRKVK